MAGIRIYFTDIPQFVFRFDIFDVIFLHPIFNRDLLIGDELFLIIYIISIDFLKIIFVEGSKFFSFIHSLILDVYLFILTKAFLEMLIFYFLAELFHHVWIPPQVKI